MTFNPPKVVVIVGTVVEVLSGLRWYRVRTGIGDFECGAVTSTGNRPTSPKELSLYGVGDAVLVLVSFNDSVPVEPAYIIGGAPIEIGQIQRGVRPCDWLSQFAGTHAGLTRLHSYLPTAYPEAVSDFNPGVPMDAVPGSDHGVINDLGVGSGVSRYYAWMRASDTCGIWCFFTDDMVRLAASNYEQWLAGGERWVKNDEGEVNDVELFSPYPWETLGLPGPRYRPFDFDKSGGVYDEKTMRTLFEPAVSDQLMYPRLMTLRGYIGDLQRDMVVRPVEASDMYYGPARQTEPERYASKTVYTGLLDIQKQSSGLYAVRSAKAIIHEKTLFIPVPKQLQPPEQDDGKADGITNYAPAGYWVSDKGGDSGVTDLHIKRDWRWATDSAALWAVAQYDYNAYMLNYYGYKPLSTHVNDWYVPQEGDAYESDVRGAYVPEVGDMLDTRYVLRLPNFVDAKIDHRDADPGTRYYQSRSVVAQMDDGSILIEDGYGSSIHMAGGNITITCPGDVFMRPGRSLTTWAPDDIVMRAGSSVDVTASMGDVRIKAEVNAQLISNSGGVVVEARGVAKDGDSFDASGGGSSSSSSSSSGDPSGGKKDIDPGRGEKMRTKGVVIRSVTSDGRPAAPVMVYGTDIYVRANVDPDATEPYGPPPDPPQEGEPAEPDTRQPLGAGRITIEADAEVVTSARDHLRFAGGISREPDYDGTEPPLEFGEYGGFTDIIGTDLRRLTDGLDWDDSAELHKRLAFTLQDPEEDPDVVINRFDKHMVMFGARSPGREGKDASMFYCGAKRVMFDNFIEDAEEYPVYGKDINGVRAEYSPSWFVVTGGMAVVDGYHNVFPEDVRYIRDAEEGVLKPFYRYAGYERTEDEDGGTLAEFVLPENCMLIGDGTKSPWYAQQESETPDPRYIAWPELQTTCRMVYDDGIRGRQSFIDLYGVSMRSLKEMGITEDFHVPAARWQHVYMKNYGDDSEWVDAHLWNEPYVLLPGEDPDSDSSKEDCALPHPGVSWVGYNNTYIYVEYDDVLYSMDDMRSIDRPLAEPPSGDAYMQAAGAGDDVEPGTIGKPFNTLVPEKQYIITLQSVTKKEDEEEEEQ